MHQNLLDRPDLPADKRAGGRSSSSRRISTAPACSTAPRSSSRKLDGSPFEHPSLGFLLSIYEQEKDWPKAIAVDAAHGGDRQAAVLQGDRALLIASSRRRRCSQRDFAAARGYIDAGARRIQGVRARDDAAGRHRRAAGRAATRRSRRGSGSSRRTRRSCRSSPSAWPTPTASRDAPRRACACCVRTSSSIRRSIC